MSLIELFLFCYLDFLSLDNKNILLVRFGRRLYWLFKLDRLIEGLMLLLPHPGVHLLLLNHNLVPHPPPPLAHPLRPPLHKHMLPNPRPSQRLLNRTILNRTILHHQRIINILLRLQIDEFVVLVALGLLLQEVVVHVTESVVGAF
jgi:hypothetical protein